MSGYAGVFLGSSAPLPTNAWGTLVVESASFTEAVDGDLVVRVGAPNSANPLVRIHSECVFGEVFGSLLCDCKEQLDIAMNAMVAEGGGLLFYLRMDGRGAGLAAKVAATSLEVEGMDTWRSRVHLGVNPDSRSFTPIGKYLAQRNYKAVRLLTNNPIKVRDLASEGISVQTLGIAVPHPNQQVLSLYRTKVNQFGHSIELSDKQ